MRLALNSVCLRPGLSPSGALTDKALAHLRVLRLKEHKLEPVDLHDPPLEEPSDGLLYVLLIQRPSGPPPWQRFFEDAFGLSGFASGSRSTGAIVFCAVADGEGRTHWIGWCFGTGSRALRRRATDPRFGLVASLNALTPPASGSNGDDSAPKLQQLEYRATSPYFQQAGHRASRSIPVEGFRFDTMSDLLASAGGKSYDPLLGDVVGGRALRFRTGVLEPRDFLALSRAAVDRWQEQRFLDAFPWANNIRPVDDEALEARLREQVLEELRQSPVSARVDVLLPDDLVALDDDRAIHYIGFPREKGASKGRVNLTIESAAKLVLREDTKRPGKGLDAPLRFFDSVQEEIDSVSVLECLCAEVALDGITYVLYDGSFFAVDDDFLARVNKDIASIPICQETFPAYKDGATEGAYLDGIKNDPAANFAVLDQSLLRVAGETPVEPCDLVTRAGGLIHVKLKGRSTLFSHLCFQVANSCALLSYSEEAQQQLFEKVEASGAPTSLIESALQGLEALPERRAGLEVTFALLGRWGDRTIESLPLLSKISLSQTHKRVAQIGYRPTLALIDATKS